MTITAVRASTRRMAFLASVEEKELPYPFDGCNPTPTRADPVVWVAVDAELGSEAFTYHLASGSEGTVHIEQVLDKNVDPSYLRDMLLYRLTLEAQKRLESSGQSRREVIRRMGTSASQFYRLLDQTNSRKTVDQMLRLLAVLGCDVELIVRPCKSGQDPA